jgi:hypothetical protein
MLLPTGTHIIRVDVIAHHGDQNFFSTGDISFNNKEPDETDFDTGFTIPFSGDTGDIDFPHGDHVKKIHIKFGTGGVGIPTHILKLLIAELEHDGTTLSNGFLIHFLDGFDLSLFLVLVPLQLHVLSHYHMIRLLWQQLVLVKAIYGYSTLKVAAGMMLPSYQ